MDRSPLHVAFSLNANFVNLAAVAIYSAIESTAQPLHIHILHSPGQESSFGPLVRMLDACNTEWTFYPVDLGRFDGLPVNGHVSLETYFRLAMAVLLPTSIDRVIYLDADLVVLSSLKELWESPRHAKGIAAVPEPGDSVQRLGLPEGSSYLNAGVLVIDLDAWRSEGVTAQLFEIAKENADRLQFWDQDVLAIYLQGDWQHLDARWNYNHRFFFGNHQAPTLTAPAIVHFSGQRLKPWDKKGRRHPYAPRFWELAEQVQQINADIEFPPRCRWNPSLLIRRMVPRIFFKSSATKGGMAA